MGEPIEQRGGHFGIAEHGRPFAERQVGGDDDRGVFVKSADEMEQQLPASAGERQIAQFVEDQEVEPRQMLGELSGAALVNLHLEPVYKIGRVVEVNASTGTDATARDSDTQMRFYRDRPTDQPDKDGKKSWKERDGR